MRKILISVLLASAAAASPVIAGPRDWSDHQQSREDRQQAREERQQSRQESHGNAQAEHGAAQGGQFSGGNHVERVNIPQQNFNGGGHVDHVNVQQGFAGGGDGANYYSRSRKNQVVEHSNDYVAPGPKTVRPDNAWREQRIEARELRQSSRPVPNVMRNRNPLIVSNTPRPGTQPPLRVDSYRSHPQVNWNTNWRHDSHYDWHNYRNHHRSRFHLGLYIDPFGWGYQPYSIGWRLWPSYYSQNYWITDPWMYRLPYAPPGYVWVRYWNDALLVDTWTGTVVDVIPGFFW